MNTIAKYPLEAFNGKVSKNIIVVPCEAGHSHDLSIPYLPHLSHWKPMSGRFLKTSKLISIDLSDFIVCGNPKFQYKIFTKIGEFKTVLKENLVDLNERFVVIVETLY